MNRMCNSVGVMFVAPDIQSRGGIAKVIENYKRSEFWRKHRCAQFSTHRDWDSKYTRIAHSLWRYLTLVWTLIASRPSVISVHTATRARYYRNLGYIILARLFAVLVVVHIYPASFYEVFMHGGTS